MQYPTILQKTREYWQDEDFKNLSDAQHIRELAAIAIRILSRMPENIGQVCGPIRNGGLGSIEKNLEHFSVTISNLQQKGLDIFDQMPFEEAMHRIVRERPEEDVLQDFYLPLFMLGRVTTLYFIQGWESSKGATWEHEKAKELGLSITYL